MKVFSLLSLVEIWEISTVSRISNSLITMFWCIVPHRHIAITGVGHCLFDTGFPEPLPDRRKMLHTFFFYDSLRSGAHFFLHMKAPTNLKHKPLVSFDDYCHYDGPYADHTDAQALSIGYAQYQEGEISAKVWRRPDKKWSRMSEEMPIHRVLDLAILYLSTLLEVNPPIEYASKIDRHPGKNGVAIIKKQYNENKEILNCRIRALKELLKYF